MGIYDREYYRDDTRGSGWLSGATPACKAIIAINVAAFIAQKVVGRSFDEWFLIDSDQIIHHYQYWRLLTGAFLHGYPWHILMNMLFLWMVGREMESFYGTRDFTAMYLVAAVFSSLCWVVVKGFQPGPHYGLGASGAVTAVVVLYTLYYPRREVLFMFIFPVEMWLLMVMYLGYDLIQFLGPGPDDFVAHEAHLGGALFGYLYKVGDFRISRLEKYFKRSPRLRIVTGEPREPSNASTRPSSGPTWSPASRRPPVPWPRQSSPRSSSTRSSTRSSSRSPAKAEER